MEAVGPCEGTVIAGSARRELGNVGVLVLVEGVKCGTRVGLRDGA